MSLLLFCRTSLDPFFFEERYCYELPALPLLLIPELTLLAIASVISIFDFLPGAHCLVIALRPILASPPSSLSPLHCGSGLELRPFLCMPFSSPLLGGCFLLLFFVRASCGHSLGLFLCGAMCIPVKH
eukprot:RCo001133